MTPGLTEIDDLFGRRLGEFVVRELIARGGFGAVYRCEQRLLGREAVVKVLHPDLRKHHVILQRFLREAQLLSRLNHPYATHVYAFGTEPDGLWWIAMERVQGVTLGERLLKRGPMPTGQFVAFFEHIAEVVQTVHDLGIVHRDLKPSNIMAIERADEVLPKLLDFGVAKLVDAAMRQLELADHPVNYPRLPAADDPASTVTSHSPPPQGDHAGLTLHNQVVGSPPYISPEQWINPATVGPASDLYALAVVAFESLSGRRPFQAATLNEFIKLHLHGQVPALGGSYPPALDRMFERALAKRPEDRFATALELADALRSAAGLGASRAELPKVDEGVRDAWLEEAPQPLAESVAALDGARNAHQARDAAQELVRALLRYLLALALATWSPTGDAQDDPALLELVRALGKRALAAEERLQLLRLLVRPHGDHAVPEHRNHSVPELVDLVQPGPDGTDALEPMLELYSLTDHAGSEDAVRLRLSWLIPELTQLLRKTSFVLDYLLVVPRDHAAERWTGQRQEHRVLAVVAEGSKLADGHPMLLDRNGRICADLWPLVQAAPPSDGAEPELFVFDGRGRCGAQLIAAPRSIVRDDSTAWSWVATYLIAEVEAKARMHDQVRRAARQWQDQARPDGLLWRGDVLADFEVWTRHTSAAPLGDLEAEFIAACRRVARRARRIRRSLVAAGMLTVLAGVVTALGVVADRAEQRTRMAEQLVTRAKVEQGRAALLHDESAQARLYLAEAYRRGDHSPEVKSMLAWALQPLMAEQARFAAAKGRMWSTAWSPDDLRIVTTDDTCAQVWDALTSRLLFTLPHGDTVYQAAYSVDGTQLITASGDGVVRIWDAASGTLVRNLRRDGMKPRFYVVALSPDDTLVAAIGIGGATTYVWNAASGALVAELRQDASDGPSLAFSPDGHWLATAGENARIFDTKTWAEVHVIQGPRVRSVSWDPSGRRLATGSAKGDASIWSIPTGARLHHLHDVGDPIAAVAFSPNGRLVVAGTQDGGELVWDASTGTLQSATNRVRSRVLSVEFDRSSTLVVAASSSGAVAVTDALSGMPVTVFDGPRNVVRVAHFDPSSRRVVGASWDGSARIWDAISPYRKWSSAPVSDDCGLVTSLEPDRRFLAVGCRDHPTRVWDTAHDQLLAELPSVTPAGGDFASAYPAVSAEGDRAAIARGNTVEVYELPGRHLLRKIAHDAPVNTVAFAGSGRDIVSGAVDGSLLVTRDNGTVLSLSRSSSGIDAAGFLPDGRIVAAVAGRRLLLYAASGEILANLEMAARARTLRWSSNGHRLVTVPSFMGKTAAPELWDVEHYRRVTELAGEGLQIFSARFVGDDVLTAWSDGAARLWDGTTGQLRQTYQGGSRHLVDVTLSSNGSMVIGGDGDGVLRFWDAASARPLWTMPAHRSHVVGVRVDGNEVITRGFSGDISRWALPDAERVLEACSRHDRCAIVLR